MNGWHGIIFSYENHEGLRELTEVRSSSSLPFGGRYRAVDFGLSNLMNAGVTDVGVILRGRYQSLLDHLGTGKNWDLSRKRGGLRLLPPFAYLKNRDGGEPFRGKAEALSSVRSYLEEMRQDHVVLMDGDLVANLPLGEMFERHLRSGNDITMICAPDSLPVENGSYVQLDEQGRVRDVLFNLHTPRGYRSLEVFLLSKALLLELVDACASQDRYSWRRDVLQANCGRLRIGSDIWSGYAAQIRSVQEYYERSMQLLSPEIRRELFCPERPIRAKSADKSSAYIGPDGVCTHSLVADGCFIEGTVENSILFDGVRVEKGAVVRGSILFKGAVVRRGASLSYVIADKDVDVREGHALMGYRTYPVVIAKGTVV